MVFCPGRQGVWPSALPGDGRPAHRAAARLRHRAMGPAPAVHPVARLAHGGPAGGKPGTALVVRLVAGPAVGHPGDRVAAPTLGSGPALTAGRTSALCCGGGRETPSSD